MDHSFKSKWESNTFLFAQKDCGYQYQGLTWPQRNYLCTFCNKEYKSAQALGGHMNVHRKDRARLRLSSPPLENPNPNPNPNPKYVSPPSPVRYLPYKTCRSTLFSLVSAANDEQQKLPELVACAGIDFLGSMAMEYGGEEVANEIRVHKKSEILNMEMDLELRLGRS